MNFFQKNLCGKGIFLVNCLLLGIIQDRRLFGTRIMKIFETSLWKRNFLSVGGSLTLIKSMLSTLPIHNISLFKMLVAVKLRLDHIKRNSHGKDVVTTGNCI